MVCVVRDVAFDEVSQLRRRAGSSTGSAGGEAREEPAVDEAGRARAAVPSIAVIRRALQSCGWLLIPVVALNLGFASNLPEAYQPQVFWKDIPVALGFAENVYRVGVFVLPCLVPLAWRSRTQRAGLMLFVVGFALYSASWALLILTPGGTLARSLVGFTSPAWTPGFWLAGLVVMADTSFIARFHPRWPLLVLSVLFLGCHVGHATFVFTRLGR